MKPQQILESSCWDRIELSLGRPASHFYRLEHEFSQPLTRSTQRLGPLPQLRQYFSSDTVELRHLSERRVLNSCTPQSQPFRSRSFVHRVHLRQLSRDQFCIAACRHYPDLDRQGHGPRHGDVPRLPVHRVSRRGEDTKRAGDHPLEAGVRAQRQPRLGEGPRAHPPLSGAIGQHPPTQRRDLALSATDEQLHLELWFEGGEQSLEVRHVSVREAISTPFLVSVMAQSKLAAIDLQSIVGKKASLKVLHGGEPKRLWKGVCSHIGQTNAMAPAQTKSLSTYKMESCRSCGCSRSAQPPHLPAPLHPRHRRQAPRRVGDRPHLEDRPRELPQARVQGADGESDYDFLSRLLEEAGIAFTFPDDDGTAPPSPWETSSPPARRAPARPSRRRQRQPGPGEPSSSTCGSPTRSGPARSPSATTTSASRPPPSSGRRRPKSPRRRASTSSTATTPAARSSTTPRAAGRRSPTTRALTGRWRSTAPTWPRRPSRPSAPTGASSRSPRHHAFGIDPDLY